MMALVMAASVIAAAAAAFEAMGASSMEQLTVEKTKAFFAMMK